VGSVHFSYNSTPNSTTHIPSNVTSDIQDKRLATLLREMLNPDPAKRPSAEEVARKIMYNDAKKIQLGQFNSR